MPALLDTKLLFVTGKGGAGKTTIAAALGLMTAGQGRRTIVCELASQHRIPVLFGEAGGRPGQERQLGPHLWSLSIDPQRTLAEWLPHQVGSRAVARLLLASDTFQYIAAAAPGSTEVVSMTALWELFQPQRWDRRAQPYDLAVVDAPASGQLVGMLRTPGTYGAVVRAGPIARQARRLRDLFEDPERTAVIAVAQASELAVNETLDLEARLHRQFGFGLRTVIVNAVLPRRFSSADVERLSRVGGPASGSGPVSGDGAAAPTGERAATSAYVRAREQSNQLNRLRRHLDAPVITLPFVFVRAVDLPEVEGLAGLLGRRLDRAD